MDQLQIVIEANDLQTGKKVKAAVQTALDEIIKAVAAEYVLTNQIKKPPFLFVDTNYPYLVDGDEGADLTRNAEFCVECAVLLDFLDLMYECISDIDDDDEKVATLKDMVVKYDPEYQDAKSFYELRNSADDVMDLSDYFRVISPRLRKVTDEKNPGDKFFGIEMEEGSY